MRKINHYPTNRKEFTDMPVHTNHHRPIHARHPLPHERNDLLPVEFDDNDFVTFSKILGNEDNAVASEEDILKAPPEIRVLAFQAMQIIHKLNKLIVTDRKENE